MKSNAVETLVGFIVIIIAVSFFVFAYNTNYKSNGQEGYILKAYFQNVEGLAQRNDVKLSGIKIGYVDSIELEKNTYFAIVRMRLNKGVEIPVDSRAIVSTNGLLGGNYIRINPGASDDNLTDNDKIKFTQSALNIEDLIGKLMYSLTNK